MLAEPAVARRPAAPDPRSEIPERPPAADVVQATLRRTTLAEIEEIAASPRSLDTPEEPAVAELIEMVHQAKGPIAARQPGDPDRLLDEVKRNHSLRAQVEDRLAERTANVGGDPRATALREELDRLRAENDALETRLRALIGG